MNIRVNLNTNIADGSEVVFRSPADCSQVTGLSIYHTGGKTEFAFADAHGNNVGDIDHLFAENAVVKVILDVTAGMAFVQNADTNAYIERTFVKSVNGINPDSDGNVEIEVGGKGSGIYIGSGDMPEGCNAQIDLSGKILDLASLMTEDEVERSIEEAMEDLELPESDGGIEVSGAEVGQFLKVAEVDENGVPTAWETAEPPEGDKWELIVDYTATDNINGIYINEDLDGNPFDLKEAWIYIYHLPALQEDGTYLASGLDLAVFDPKLIEPGISAKRCIETPHFWGITTGITAPSASGTGAASSTIHVVSADRLSIFAHGSSSQNGSSLASTLKNYVGMWDRHGQYLKPIDKTDPSYSFNENILRAYRSINALVVGGMSKYIGTGSVFKMYGIRRGEE